MDPQGLPLITEIPNLLLVGGPGRRPGPTRVLTDLLEDDFLQEF